MAQRTVGWWLVEIRAASFRTHCDTGQATSRLWDAPDSRFRASVSLSLGLVAGIQAGGSSFLIVRRVSNTLWKVGTAERAGAGGPRRSPAPGLI